MIHTSSAVKLRNVFQCQVQVACNPLKFGGACQFDHSCVHGIRTVSVFQGLECDRCEELEGRLVHEWSRERFEDNFVGCHMHLGGHAWVIANKETNEAIITGEAPVNGKGHELTSTRAEMLGIIAIITTLKTIYKQHNLPRTKIHLYTDSKTSITNAIRNLKGTRQMLLTDIDVIFQLQHELKNLPFSLVITHVKGHQDQKKPYDELTNAEKLNCDMDHKVNDFMKTSTHTTKSYSIFPAQKYFIKIRNKITPNNIPTSLLASYNHTVWKKHVKKRLGLNADCIKKVDWLPVQKLLARNTHTSGYVKSIHMEWNTMDRCKLWKTSATDTCPLCEEEVESWEHVYQCKNEHANRERKVYLNLFKDKLNALHTHPSLRDLILSVLHNLCNKQKPSFTPKNNPDSIETLLSAIFISQNNIGWTCFLKGIVSKKWGEAQEKYYREQKMAHEFNKQRWCNKLTSLLADFQRTLWNNRCNIVKLENEVTLEKRKRQQLFELHNHINRNPWKLRTSDRHLLRHNEKFFRKASIQQVDIWEQQVFVALNRANNNPTQNNMDIRTYGNLRSCTNPSIIQLRPTQISSKYNQCSLHQFFQAPPVRPTYTTTDELQQLQHQIDSHLNQPQPIGTTATVHNSPSGHRHMAQVSSILDIRRSTCKINIS